MSRKLVYYMSSILLVLVLLSGSRYFMKERSKNASVVTDECTIVIDPGHGGVDPGKVGVNNALEKDINLAISLKLCDYMEKKGYTIVLTREEDVGLYAEGDSNKKQTDMKKRVQLIEETNPAVAVSIHQNSFTQESSKGAQVFYHQQSEEGKKLAEILQSTIKNTILDDNHRVAKANDSYYMLKKTACPLVIVECGFLSNYAEAELLATEEYQQKMAEAIAEGIIIYLNEKQQNQ